MTGVIQRPDEGTADSDDSSLAANVTALLIAYKWVIVFGLCAVAVWAYEASIGLPSWSGLPKWSKIVIVGGVGSMIFGYLPANWLYKRHFHPSYTRLNEVDALRDVNRSYDVPEEVWEERKQVVDGELYLNSDGEYVVRRVDWTGDALELHGVWKGEATDTELETFRHALEETRGRQRWWMQVGKTLKAKMPYYLRSLEQSITEKVARKTIEKQTDTIDLYEEEVVESAEIAVDSIDVPDGYYSDELESEVDKMLDEDTERALSNLDETADTAGDSQ